MPTASTLPLLLLVMILWRWTRGNVLAVVAFLSIFDGASALNLGSFAITPWIFALVLCLPFAVMQKTVRLGKLQGAGGVPLHGFAAYFSIQALSGIFYPVAFAGLLVLRQADLVPLAWGMPNVAQICYMLLSAFILYLTISARELEVDAAVQWYVRGCVVAAGFSVYQWLHEVIHLPYPESVLYSNASHNVYHAYMISGVWRLNSTFTEASDMAGSLIGGLAILVWQCLHRPFHAGRYLATAFVAASMLATLSTTAYLCLALLAAYIVWVGLKNLLSQSGFSGSKAVLAVLVLAVLGGSFAISAGLRDTATKVMNSVLMEKQNSESYQASQMSHAETFRVLHETMYLGVGLGSMRARGLLYTLAAGSGVPGVFAFMTAILSLFAIGWYRTRSASRKCMDTPAGAMLFGLFLFFAGMVVVGSEPVYPVFWIFVGSCLIQTMKKELPKEVPSKVYSFPLGQPMSYVPHQTYPISQFAPDQVAAQARD